MTQTPQSFPKPQLSAVPLRDRARNDTGFNPTPKDGPRIPASALPQLLEGWAQDCQIRSHSTSSIVERGKTVRFLLRYLDENNLSECGKKELRSFFLHLANGHLNPGGRWGHGELKGSSRELKPATVETYFRRIHAFFTWMVHEEYIAEVPLSKTWLPNGTSEQIIPFTTDQIERLFRAACKTEHALRDEALFLGLLSTGLRSSEIANLRMKDIDLYARTVDVIQGKGKKDRQVSIGADATKALRAYIRAIPRDPGDAVFLGERGGVAGGGLTRWGIRLAVRRWGRVAGITAARCSPHTFRHTMAIMFLNAGGSIHALQRILGHASIKTTMRYVNLANADQQNQHRKHDVADSLNLRR